MDATAAQKNVSDGNWAVWDSMDFAIYPSVCSRRSAVQLSDVVSCGSAAMYVADVMVRRCLLAVYDPTCAPVDAVPTMSFSPQEDVEGRF